MGRLLVVAVTAVVMLTGCGSSDPSGPETTGTATTTAAEPAITSFEVGELSCGHGVAAPVTVAWKTENATAVEITLDSSSPTGYGPDGSTEWYVVCDGASHTISITPLSDTARGAPQSEEVSPE